VIAKRRADENADEETLQLKWIDDVPKLQIENSDTIEAMRSNNLKARG